jgi:hypothetical protein
MKLPKTKVPSTLINRHISIVYKTILPAILIFVIVSFVLGFRMRNKRNMNQNLEGWVNYMNIPFGEVKTGVDCPIGFYERPEYRLPYRWPIGIKTDNPVKHIAPLMN